MKPKSSVKKVDKVDKALKEKRHKSLASIKERSGKQKFKLEGRDLASLNASPERKGIM